MKCEVPPTPALLLLLLLQGGVYCIIGVHIANLIVNWREMRRSFWNHWAILAMIVFLVAIEIYETYTNK